MAPRNKSKCRQTQRSRPPERGIARKENADEIWSCWTRNCTGIRFVFDGGSCLSRVLSIRRSGSINRRRKSYLFGEATAPKGNRPTGKHKRPRFHPDVPPHSQG